MFMVVLIYHDLVVNACPKTDFLLRGSMVMPSPSSYVPCSTRHRLQQPLPRQLDLLRELAFLPPALAPADSNALSELNLVFCSLPSAGAVVREVDAGQGAGAEVVRALRCVVISQDS